MLADVLARIDKRLNAVGLAESAAAVKAGLSDSAIRNIRRAVKQGRTQGASTRTLEKLAPVLKTSASWLMDGAGSETGDEGGISVTDVPHISWVSAGQLTDQDTVHSFDDYPVISALDLPEGDWIALTVDGNSMNKISPPGSIIFVNRRDKRLVSNACYVVADENGAATYKRYRPNDDPPFQPASYDEIAPPRLVGAIQVIGRVRRSIIDF